MSNPEPGDVAEALATMIADDLGKSIANLGYPVGMGMAPHPDALLNAGREIIARIKPKALALLAERKTQVTR